MIFSGNTTALGATTIPMAEGYDCSYGAPLALVEATRNDMAMFQALLQSDYREMAICNESTGIVREGEISALNEAVGGGIFKKIAELFRKLVAKVKSIFHNLIAKLRGLYMKDKELVKKYSAEIGRKTNIDKLEVKWRKTTSNITVLSFFVNVIDDSFDEKDAVKNYSDDSWERVKHYLNTNADSASEYIEEEIDKHLEPEDMVTLKEIGGWTTVTSFLSNYDKNLRDMESNIKKNTTTLEKLVKKYDDKAKGISKARAAGTKYKDKDGTEYEVNENIGNDANMQYDMAQAYQTAVLTTMQAMQQFVTIEYKQNKAAFMKMVTVNTKKLEETAIYAEAVAEAAADEVDTVIQSALSDEEISDLSIASTNVKDGDVSDDPDKLTWEKVDHYTDNASFSNSNGSIDTRIGGGKVEESAYFGEMFY